MSALNVIEILFILPDFVHYIPHIFFSKIRNYTSDMWNFQQLAEFQHSKMKI